MSLAPSLFICEASLLPDEVIQGARHSRDLRAVADLVVGVGAVRVDLGGGAVRGAGHAGAQPELLDWVEDAPLLDDLGPDDVPLAVRRRDVRHRSHRFDHGAMPLGLRSFRVSDQIEPVRDGVLFVLFPITRRKSRSELRLVGVCGLVQIDVGSESRAFVAERSDEVHERVAFIAGPTGKEVAIDVISVVVPPLDMFISPRADTWRNQQVEL
mmetsp:Transcript_32858/g.66700  ORF Transcript_32858/g.66700 Transcript_32858/m.66700 type:complete len:212 (-) Transcript_32858:498-1133(-)